MANNLCCDLYFYFKHLPDAGVTKKCTKKKLEIYFLLMNRKPGVGWIP